MLLSAAQFGVSLVFGVVARWPKSEPHEFAVVFCVEGVCDVVLGFTPRILVQQIVLFHSRASRGTRILVSA